MFSFSGTISSKTLNMATGLTVSLPTDFDGTGGEKLPVLYLLHGLSDNHSCWLRRTAIDRYAQEAGIAVIMPEVQRSFYANMKFGLNYFDYISLELPELCKKLFPITHDPEKTFVAGLSMGGYGALKVGLTYPEKFGGAASFSGAVDMAERIKVDDDLLMFKERIGINNNEINPEDDLFYLAEKAAKGGSAAIPSIYITCGYDDFLYADNQRFKTHLEKLELPFVYEEWEGAHEWSFWDKSVYKALKIFLGTDGYQR